MSYSGSNPKVAVVHRPIYSALAAFPAVSFTLALLTDVAYWQTANLMWQNFSSWLLFAGLVFGVFAGLGEAIDFLRTRRPAWMFAFGNLVVFALAFLNSLVHAGDGWTAVVPYGLILSAVTVCLILVTFWLGRATTVDHIAGERAYD